MVKIVGIDPIVLFPEHVKKLESLGELTLCDTVPNDDVEIIDRVGDAEIILGFWTALSKSVIQNFSNVKMICSAAAGYDWIDVKAAIEKEITVTHCPGHNAQAVAEHTVGLLLAAMRLTRKASCEVRKGEFLPESYVGKELKGKTVGIIGYGSIGKKVAEILQRGFGAKIVYVNSRSSREDLERLLIVSDFISINAPLSDKTRNLISDREFDLMKDDVVIVNTGRGAIIDEIALLQNLENGKVFAAGLDTLAKEPFQDSNPLLSYPNVIITPHIGWNTRESEYRLSAQVVEIITAFVQGNPIYIIPEQRR